MRTNRPTAKHTNVDLLIAVLCHPEGKVILQKFYNMDIVSGSEMCSVGYTATDGMVNGDHKLQQFTFTADMSSEFNH